MITAREGERTGKGSDNWIQALSDLKQITTDPKAGFPGKDRITILCMGIDDNWTDKDMVYTKGARTDTLFMLGLDLNTKHVSMLSIPRDSYVPIAGTERSNKINAAYSIGGPKMAMDTVGQLLGVQPDYYIVIKIDGTATMVNALGGVDVNVEHELNYDDNWGHLHVHLKPGFQHLNGPDAVGFARFRHGNKGVTPEDGDQRRIYRQHELMRAMVEKIKSAGNLIKPNYLVDTAMSCIATDLSRTQLFDLGAIFHSVKQEEIQTAQVSGTDARSSSGAYIMRLDDEEVKLLSDWLLRGDALAGRALTPVVVVNGTKVSGLAASTADYLKSLGYSTIKVGSYSKKEEVQKSSIVDGGVANRGAAAEAASFLGIPATSLSREIVKPNKYGWAPPPAVTIYLGTDYAAHPQGAAPVPAGSTQPPSSGT
jgi:LCP family protein required for cell wall assembly